MFNFAMPLHGKALQCYRTPSVIICKEVCNGNEELLTAFLLCLQIPTAVSYYFDIEQNVSICVKRSSPDSLTGSA